MKRKSGWKRKDKTLFQMWLCGGSTRVLTGDRLNPRSGSSRTNPSSRPTASILIIPRNISKDQLYS